MQTGLVVVLSLQFILGCIYLFVRQNFYFVFGDLRRLRKSIPKQNTTIYKDIMLGDIILAHIKFYVTKIKIGSLFGFSMLQKFQKRKIGLIPHRVM